MGQKDQNTRRNTELTFSELSVPAAFPAPISSRPTWAPRQLLPCESHQVLLGPACAASQQQSGGKAEASVEIPSSPGSAFQLPQHGLPSGFIKLGL